MTPAVWNADATWPDVMESTIKVEVGGGLVRWSWTETEESNMR